MFKIAMFLFFFSRRSGNDILISCEIVNYKYVLSPDFWQLLLCQIMSFTFSYNTEMMTMLTSFVICFIIVFKHFTLWDALKRVMTLIILINILINNFMCIRAWRKPVSILVVLIEEPIFVSYLSIKLPSGCRSMSFGFVTRLCYMVANKG